MRPSGGPWLVPDWPAPAGVRALFTLRGTSPGDGASRGPWRYFNLGDHVGDEADAVAANRACLQQALGARPVFLQQVHGTAVAQLDAATPDGSRADAAVTATPRLACTVMVADCLPLLLSDARGERVAAAHAGWRGLAAGVVERTLARLGVAATDRAAAADVLAWLGPCIGPAAFEVGPEVRAAFLATDPGAQACFRPGLADRWLADLPALARRRLAALGVTRIHGNDGSADWCTVTQETRFFSFRRDQQTLGGSGRMAACIWRI